MSSHSTLNRQLKRLGISLDSAPSKEEWQGFLETVVKTYKQADQDRYTLERSLDLSSIEMNDLYEKLKISSESKLAHEKDRLSTVVSCLKDGLAVLAGDGGITRINPAGAKFFSKAPDDLFGSDFFELVGLVKYDILSKLESSSESIVQESAVSLLYNVDLVVEFTFSPIFTKENKIAEVVVLFRDITTQKAIELAAKEARDLAIEAAKVKSNFLATMSHEIRTPINGIVSLVDLLIDSDLNEEQKIDALTIKSCSDSLRLLMDNILNYSKMEAEKLFIEKTKTNLRREFKKIEEQLSFAYSENQQVCVLDIDSDIPETLEIDRIHFMQVLSNLVSNAIKFTPVGGAVIVLIEKSSSSIGESVISCSVADTGVGIPEGKEQIVFESFSQLDTSPTRKYDGTGLGLTVCKRLVDMMHGEISVRSKEGSGTVISFSIPYPDETKKITASKVKRKEDKRSNGALNILLVEDNEINQNTISRILKMWGHTVTIAENGLKALDVVDSDKFDIILMDLHMPEMGGLEAATKIRNEEIVPVDLPIVALTADVVGDVKEACFKAGMNGYISKPIDYDQLQETIAELV